MKEKLISYLENILPWALEHGVKIIFIIIGSFILNKIANRFIEKVVRITITADQLTSKDGEKKREDTLIKIFSTSSTILILTIATLMILGEIGLMIGPILAGAGIVGLAFGFGGQYLIRDIIAGLFIIIENQYRIGDVVSFGTIGGLVEDISLRMTTLRDMDGTVHHVPHGEIKTVSNMSKVFSRVNLNVGVSYSADLDHVINVVNKIGNDLANDEKWKDFIIKAPQFLRVDKLGDSAIDIKIVGDTLPIKQWDVTGELRKRIKIGFDKEGIEIPFPQRVIHQATKIATLQE
ncbi:mechanosensitive ion channel family protein [uncultured Cytophaga sp.]|uniref:mechanosensitive ion channel family protein n=1 Tax=uncultured Cytophaga sp. TaxID=160238 RepID=UPI00262D8F16|nr:mechanosensitive ion channel family protein [uncultured Cytophaga sp.]